MATTFWLSVGYNFGSVIASSMIFDYGGFGVKLSDGDRRSKGRCHGNQFWD